MGSMKEMNELSSPQWVDSLNGYLKPYWDDLLQGDWCEGVANTRLTVPEMRGWILQTYPFIHAFPKFLAEGLIKVEDDYSRSFLIDNIRVEKAHAEHWIWMGQGFGLTRQEMLDAADGTRPVLRDVQSLTDWLWYINTKGSKASPAISRAKWSAALRHTRTSPACRWVRRPISGSASMRITTMSIRRLP